MGRPLRIEVPDGIFHVYARGNDRKPIFLDDEDYQRYLRLLGTTTERRGWHLLSFCLMPNHVHLLVQTPNANLSTGMQTAHSKYARAFNERHGQVGHVFQGRFGSKRILGDAQMWVTLAYIAANPVEAALTREPSGWAWSSHRHLLGTQRAPRWLATSHLLGMLAPEDGEGRAFYERLVRDRLTALAA
jgi:REP element-mobilizing transposase RayT